MCRKILFFALLLLSTATTFADDDNNNEEKTVSLTTETFDEAIKKNNHFVKFFAPWCGHCKRLQPLWEDLAEMMNVDEDPKVIIAKVDCTEHQELCNKNEVTGYPTLKLFKVGENEAIRFRGTRDMPAITEFINKNLESDEDQKIPSKVGDVNEPPLAGTLFELTEESFPKHVSSGNHFVKFYAPWCSHCQRLAPTWESLANAIQHEKSVTIAKIDCTQYRSICQDFEVKGYPTLLWIEDGKKIEKYLGGRDLDALKEYAEKMLGADSKTVPSAVEDAKSAIDKKKVLELTGNEFVKTIENGVTFVKFYAPWCGHCKKLSPTWDQLAEKMHDTDNNIKIAKVDCTAAENKDLCMEQQIEGYPTLFAYKNGEKQSEYDGSRSLAELQHYIKKFVVHDEL